MQTAIKVFLRTFNCSAHYTISFVSSCCRIAVCFGAAPQVYHFQDVFVLIVRDDWFVLQALGWLGITSVFSSMVSHSGPRASDRYVSLCFGIFGTSVLSGVATWRGMFKAFYDLFVVAAFRPFIISDCICLVRVCCLF